MYSRLFLLSPLFFLLTACGGVGERLPATLAEELAGEAEAVAASLEQGDTCDADARADQLVSRVRAGLRDGSIPPAIGEELRRRAQSLASDISCAVIEPETTPESPEATVEESPTEVEDDDDDEEEEDEETDDESEDNSGEGSGDEDSSGEG
jgi:hypothetical protein